MARASRQCGCDGRLALVALASSNPASGDIVPVLPARFPFEEFVLTDALPPPEVTVKEVLQEVFKGSKSVDANPTQVDAVGAASAFAATSVAFLPLKQTTVVKMQATVAADRPELYTFGSASAKAALGLGFEPYFPAAARARERAVAVAQLLGVRLGYDSLFALYPNEAGSDARIVGVGTTFSGGDPSNWEKIEIPSTIRASRDDGALHGGLVPITVPDETTVIAEAATAEVNMAIRRRANCPAIQRELLGATIRQNWAQAQRDARRSQRKIRKLLVFAVVPEDDASAGCARATSMMTFRTFAAQGSDR